MKRKKIYGIFMLVAIAVFLFAGGRILQIYLNYQESQKVYEQMEGFTQKIEDQDLSPEAVPGETPEEVAEQGVLQVDFNKLEEINPDVIAWIEIPGLEISYPVVQGRDNDYYLHHLITGENHKSGSIFMDFHNQEDLSDRNTIIYGHNMKDGSMFGTLDQYQSQALYRKPDEGKHNERKCYGCSHYTGMLTGSISNGRRYGTVREKYSCDYDISICPYAAGKV